MTVITISRGTKSGGIALAELLAERLDYLCVSREVLLNCSNKFDINEQDLWNELRETPSLWRRLTNKHRSHLACVRCSLLQMCKQDKLVYHGHAGQIFLEGISHVLKVRIEAPLEFRLNAVIAELGLGVRAAQEYLRKEDEHRERWVRFFYNRDWHDVSLYDLVVNISTMNLDTIADLICDLVKREEYAPTPQSLKKTDDLALQFEIEARLAEAELCNYQIAVQTNGGAVLLRGNVKSEKQKRAIEGTVGAVVGVESVESHIGLLSDLQHETSAFG